LVVELVVEQAYDLIGFVVVVVVGQIGCNLLVLDLSFESKRKKDIK
jgi:hypothetical protein